MNSVIILVLLSIQKPEYSDAEYIDLSDTSNSPFRTISQNVIDKCPNVGKEAYSPHCPRAYVGYCETDPEMCATTNLSALFIMDRLYLIDDVTEQFHVSGSLVLEWYAPCPGGYVLPNADLAINADEKSFWKPHLHHKNCVSDYALTDNFATLFQLEGTNRTDRAMNFYLQLSGVFSSTSNLNYILFPFDQQTLSIDFMIVDIACATRFHDVRTREIDAAKFAKGTGWSFIAKDYNYGTEENYGQNRSVASFFLSFRRKPEFYIFNLMLPTFILTSLQLASFLMPTKLSDRPVFDVSLLLALMFLQGQILAHIPVKPTRVFLGNYTDLCAIFSWGCTIYALATCGMAESPSWKGWLDHEVKISKLGKIRRNRVMDVAAFIAALLIFLGINGYALIIIVDSGYFLENSE